MAMRSPNQILMCEPRGKNHRQSFMHTCAFEPKFAHTLHANKQILMLRDGGHISVLALIPGTMEQLQAKVSAMEESMRNMEKGQGGPRIHVPECLVI